MRVGRSCELGIVIVLAVSMSRALAIDSSCLESVVEVVDMFFPGVEDTFVLPDFLMAWPFDWT